MGDSDVAKKLRTQFDWCLRRIRRHVPPPEVLEKRYQEVIDLFSGVVDSNTNKPFFNDRAEKVHKAILKHIRRNCLSDIPGVSYYIQVGTDKLGIPLLKCCRGTSALKRLHQKLRQLIRGYANSPCFARALVFEFIYRWNHDLDVAARGLPSEYGHFYEGSALEKEIQIMTGWGNELDAHPNWVSATSFACTGEYFGIPKPTSELFDTEVLTPACYSPGDEDLLRENDAINAADACGEMEAGDEANKRVSERIEKESKKRHSSLPASASWLCDYAGRSRPLRKVQSGEEWKFFEEHYMDYQDNGISSSADTYSFVNWSVFATDWCEKVFNEEQQGKTSSFTYKNAAILKEAWKVFRRRANEATTMLGHHDAAKDLRQKLQDTSTQTVRSIVFPHTQVGQPVAAPAGQAGGSMIDTLFEDKSGAPILPLLSGNKRKRTRKKKDKGAPKTHHRCRRCGREFNVEPWKEMHKPVEFVESSSKTRERNLNYQAGNKPSDH